MERPVVRAALLIDASCALSASLYIPMRTRCERVPTASTRTDKMSKATEFGSCPDAFRSLNTEELSELLQNDDKMDQIIALDEKVKPWDFLLSFKRVKPNSRCFAFLANVFIAFGSRSTLVPDLLRGAHLLPAWRVIGFPLSS